MLAFILAIAVALASVTFFLSAFFAPKLHRQDDFFWSGVGFFYALVLWVCARRFTGGVLLGQLAAVTLILGFAWQTLRLRGAIANGGATSELQSFSLMDWLSGGKRKLATEKKPAKPGFWGRSQTTVAPVTTTEPSPEAKVPAPLEENQVIAPEETHQPTGILEEMEVIESEGIDNSDAITIIETSTRIVEEEIPAAELTPNTDSALDSPPEESSTDKVEPV
jgi:hypothetical protein